MMGGARSYAMADFNTNRHGALSLAQCVVMQDPMGNQQDGMPGMGKGMMDNN
jgi:hypothetical protein